MFIIIAAPVLSHITGELTLAISLHLCILTNAVFKNTKIYLTVINRYPYRGQGPMIKIEYPPYRPRIKEEAGKELIFDEARKQWVALTPEEWVRQNFLQYLLQVKKYPASLIAIEKEIKLGELKKRFDIVVYDKDTKPWMIIECKEMGVVLDEKVLNQVLRYNITLNVPYLVITNGNFCMALAVSNGDLTEINNLPAVFL